MHARTSQKWGQSRDSGTLACSATRHLSSNTMRERLYIIGKHRTPPSWTSCRGARLAKTRSYGGLPSTEASWLLRDKRHDRVGILSDKQTQQHETSISLRNTNPANDGRPITSNRHDYGRMRQQQVYVPAYPPSTCSCTYGSTSHSLLKHVALSTPSAHFNFTSTRCTINFHTNSSKVELYSPPTALR
jgi:hypothetical protein